MDKATTAEYNKKYYQAHKKDILKGMSEMIRCEVCNCNIQKQWKARHENTFKHQRNKNKPEIDQLEKELYKKRMEKAERIQKEITNILKQMKELSQ